MIYVCLIIILFCLFQIERNNRNNKQITFWISTVLFVGLFALRGDNVGGDTLEYCKYFEGKDSSTYGTLKYNENIEIGFRFLCVLLQQISLSHFWFILSTSLISLIPFVLIVRKYSISAPLSYFYVICSNFCIMVVCIETHIRQNIATALIMLAIYILNQNKLNRKTLFCGLLLSICGLLTHTSIYLILPFLILLYFIPLNKAIAINIIISSCIITVFFTKYYGEYFMGLMAILSPYEAFDNITRYMESDKYGLSDTVGIFTHFAPIAFWVIVNIYYSTYEELNNIYMKCLVIGSSLIIMSTSFGMSFRMFYALQILGVCYIPQAIVNNKRAMCLNFFPYLYLFYRIVVGVMTPSNYNTDSHYLPYNFIFE